MFRLRVKYILFGIVLVLNSCGSNSNKEERSPSETDTNMNLQSTDTHSMSSVRTDSVTISKSPENSRGEISINIVKSGTGFGYQLLMNGKPYISQMNIPAVQGIQYFSSEEKATKAAKLIKYKVEHDILPPSVSLGELDSIGALK